MRTSSLLTLSLLLAPSLALAHAEHDKARFVAADGADAGQCDDRTAPCRTIAYAASRAGKGDRILVARGRYGMQGAEELFYVLSGVVRVQGGYARAERFERQAPADHPTILTGVPPELRERLESLGFQVIVDSKGLDAQAQEAMRSAGRSLALMQRSAGPAICADGDAGGFPCVNADLLSHLALGDFSTAPSAGNDVWGFVDLNTEREYAFMGLHNGTAVVDVTDPAAPVEVGTIAGSPSTWRNIKTYQYYDAEAERWHAYAYSTTDAQVDKLAIIDLGGLPNHVALVERGTDEIRAHTMYIGHVDYSTGTPLDGLEPVMFTAGSDLTSGGFRAYALSDPAKPRSVAVSPTRTYMHDSSSLVITDSRKDTQCVHAIEFCSVLLDFNETTVDLWDYSEQADPRQLSSTGYANASYVHSGWPTEDGQYLFVHDELDERNFGLSTTVRVFSLAGLGGLTLAGTWVGPTAAIDHNGYVRGNRYYMSNYTRGLTVLDITNPAAPVAVASLDTYTPSDATSFNGAWGAFPFLPSGNVLVGDINSGLYVVRDRSLETDHGSLAFTSGTAGGVEGDTVQIGVARVGGTSGAVSVAYETLSSTADPSDYEAVKGRLSWAAGDASSRSVSLALAADGAVEGPQRVFLRLYDPKGGATLLSPSMTSVFVSDAGAAPELAFADDAYVVRRGVERALLVVSRRGSAQGAVTVSYRTVATSAQPGQDYTEVVAGELTWPDGDATARTIAIALLPAAGDTGAEAFRVELFSPQGATLGAVADAQVEVGNHAPAARAGSDLTVSAAANVELSASQSTDPEGDRLTYVWLQRSGLQVALADNAGATARFTAPSLPIAEALEFILTATDAAGNTTTDPVTVTVSAVPGGGGGGGGAGGSDGDGGGGALGPLALLLILARSYFVRARVVRG